ncbi:DUF5801 repeats-in-toxin domain-containing protein, partial [Kiloniella sp. b19]|uniref:DUF5801 repeats-in-toxin domain-containing protein n=1 Tax=Kiloniella sp. GXU_MW_B19 TaxID=3141326 RepID=UPI0031E20347
MGYDIENNDVSAVSGLGEETLTGNHAENILIGQTVVQLVLPENGTSEEFEARAGQSYQLNFDAGSAVPSVSGSDFILSFDTDQDGQDDSSIVFQNLVSVAQSSDGSAMPDLIVDGIVIPADQLIEQVIALAAEDGTLETAAGAGPALGGGGSSYNDDLGSIIDLLNPQGPLGATELAFAGPGLGAETADAAEGVFTLSFLTTITEAPEGGITGSFAGGFEDALPNQHVNFAVPSDDLSDGDEGSDDNPLNELDPDGDGETFAAPMQLIFDFEPADNETLDSVTITAIEGYDPTADAAETVRIFVGGFDAESEVTGVALPLVITPENFGAVFVVPVRDSDADISFSGTAAISDPDSGLGNVLPFSATAVIDAVADVPDFFPDEVPGPEVEGEVLARNARSVSVNEEQTLDLPVDVTLRDTDGSESLSLEVSGVPASYDLVGLPAGWTAERGVLTETAEGLEDLQSWTITYTGEAVPAPTSFNGNISFDTSDYTTRGESSSDEEAHGRERSGAERSAEADSTVITVSAIATEGAEVGGDNGLSGGELSDDNNVAVARQDYTVAVIEDVPTITSVTLVHDESAGIQNDLGKDDVSTVLPQALQALLADKNPAGLEGALEAGEVIGVARNSFGYDLKTDGSNDESGDPHSDSADQSVGSTGANDGLENLSFEITNGQDSGLRTVKGQRILLYRDEENDNIVYGVVAGEGEGAANSLAFVAVLQEDGTGLSDGAHTGTATWIQYLPLRHPDGGSSHDEQINNGDADAVNGVLYGATLAEAQTGGGRPGVDQALANNPAFGSARPLSGDSLEDRSVAENTLTKITGQIWLEAGQSYQFRESVDDGARLTIDGEEILNDTVWNQSTTGSFTPQSSGFYSFEFVALNWQGPGPYELEYRPQGQGAWQSIRVEPELPTQPDLSLPIRITDDEGDSSVATLKINIHDDGPTITATGAADALTVDESDLTTDATANFADNFTIVAGVDGQASVTYALSVTDGTASGVVDTATGQAVSLYANNGVIEGRAGGSSGPVVFTLSVNSAGTVELDQLRAVEHGDNTEANEAVSLAANVVTLTATVTDGDGDTASDSIRLGSTISFRDDVPTITVTGAVDALTVDESTLGTDATANFADNFTIVAGADGQASVTYALSATDETDSGVVDTATGYKVYLFEESGEIVGRVGNSDDTANDAGAIVFTLSVNGSGTVELDQLRAVEHGDTTNANEAVSLAANVVTLTATVTDGDGDTASDSIQLGSTISFRDDAPTANNDADSVTEDGATVATGNVITGTDVQDGDANTTDGVADDAGADGLESIAWTDVSNGAVAGSHGTLSVGADGSYSYALNNGSAAVQGLASGETLTETFTYTITDGDGDTDTATLTITINGADDGVTITNLTPQADGGDVSVDEDDLASGSDSTKESLTQSGTFNISTPDGLDDLTIGGTTVIENGVFTATTIAAPDGLGSLRITAFNAVTGEVSYSFTLADNADHASGNGENDAFASFAVVVTDTDGDSASNSLVVRIVDDVPTITATGVVDALTVDESDLTTDATANFADNFTIVAGADGQASVTYALSATDETDSGVVDTATGYKVYLFEEGGEIVGRVGNSDDTANDAGAIVFTLSVNSAGTVELDQLRAVEHGDNTEANEAVSLAANVVTLTATVTDGDGDTASDSIQLGSTISFRDDAPTANNDVD